MFERQIRLLKHRYHLVGLSEGISRLAGPGGDRPLAAITLDDGFADNYQFAWPVLARNQAPATIFLATDFVNAQRAPWPTRLWDIVNAIGKARPGRTRLDAGALYRNYQQALRVLPADTRFEELDRIIAEHRLTHLPVRKALSWEQVREMNSTGIEFGSHTVFHGLLPFLDAAEVEFELANSKRKIEEVLQTGCDYFAYPNGDHNSGVASQTRRLGYRAALTQDFGANNGATDVFHMKRIEVPYHDPLPSFAYRARKAISEIQGNQDLGVQK